MESKNPYKAPETTNLAQPSEIVINVPLSQASAKKKLLISIPGALVCWILAVVGILEAITKFLAIALTAYAIVGVVELLGGESLISAVKKWDTLSGWKKFIISALVIFIALGISFSLMSIFAE